MMILQKYRQIVIILLAVLSLVILSTGSLSLFFNLTYPENRLRNFLSDFCKESLGKAVKFDEITISFTGNIHVKNFSISVGSDFNDNVSFIQAGEAEVDINFLQLFRGRVLVEGIHFGRSTVTIQKIYGRDYRDNFRSLFSFLDTLKNQRYINLDNFTVTFKRSDFIYHEFFSEHKLTVVCRNSGMKISSGNKGFTYRFEGIIMPYKTAEITTGDISLSGRYFYDKERPSWADIAVDNLDASLFSDYMAENELGKLLFSGGLSADLKIAVTGDEYTVSGDIDTNNLTVTSNEAQQYDIVSNENFNVEMDISLSRQRQYIHVRELKLYDDILDFDISGAYFNNKDSRELKLSLESNNIDLEDLSRNFSPVKDVTYRGKFRIKAGIDYDIEKNTAREMNISSTLKDFAVIKNEKGRTRELLSGASFDVSLKQNDLSLQSAFRIGRSDFSIKGKTGIKSFYPPASDTTMSVVSEKLGAGLLRDAVSMGLDKILLESYMDQQAGYDEVYFLRKKAGIVANANNFQIEWKAGSIFFPGNAALKNLHCAFRMDKGVLSLEDFNLEGYEGQYNLELQGYFNRDYPFIMVKGGAGQLDLGKMSRDMKAPWSVDGRLNIDFSYELTAYRLFHILQNSKGNVNASLSQGRISNTEIQERLTNFLIKNGLDSVNLKDLQVNSLAFALAQSGENFYGSLALNSDYVNFSANGSYGYYAGLKMPSYVTVRDTTGKTTGAPMEISGRLQRPELLFKAFSREPFVLFQDVQ